MKVIKYASALVLVLGMGSAYASEAVALTDASEPMALTETQMDDVTAGFGLATAAAGSVALGFITASLSATTATSDSSFPFFYTLANSTSDSASASLF